MAWKRHVTREEEYQRWVKDAAETVRTGSPEELEKLKRGLKARIEKLERGAAADPVLGDNEAADLQRVVNNINDRLAHLARVAAGGVDPGRKEAEEGTSPLHARLRDAYAELDRIEGAEGDPTEVRRTISRLKKAISEGGELGKVAPPDEVQERKRGERRYAGAL